MTRARRPDWEILRPELIQRGFTRITEIGRGGMGYVLRAWDVDLERWVAIKLITRFAASNPENVRRFRSEMRLLGRINHPAVVTVYDGKMTDDFAYFLMSYVPGGSLEQLLEQRRERRQSFTLREVVDYLQPVADALDATHAMTPPVVHRDIKPANILTPGPGGGRSPSVLTDFGISLVGRDTRFTSTGIVIGSEKYMAPERFTAVLPDDDGGPSADNYALALIAWEMLTLTPVFSTMTRQKSRFDRPIPDILPGALAPADHGCEKSVNRVFRRLLAHDPGDRPARASDALTELERAAARGPGRTLTSSTRPVEAGAPRARTDEPRPYSRAKLISVAVVAVIALTGLVIEFGADRLTWSEAPDDVESVALWSQAQQDLVDRFPGITPDVPGTRGTAALSCSPGTPADGQRSQIVCGDDKFMVTLVNYADPVTRTGALGAADDHQIGLHVHRIDSVKRGRAGEWVLLADDGQSAAFVTGVHAEAGYHDLNYC